MSRLLVDTGPLVALLNRGDPDHERCAEYLKHERAQLLTTWPVITEAMYLLRRSVVARGAILTMIQAEELEPADILALVERIAALIDKYEDLPMDFADATLVAVAEQERLDTVFTLDDDFQIYRVRRQALRMVP
ncbi:PIN domain-containing protein [soil metagenome]